jgi:hypothetical protein
MRFLLLYLRRESIPPFAFAFQVSEKSSSVCLEMNADICICQSSLGVGAPLPEKAADGSWNRTELSSNDQLRKQLLGRNYDKFMKAAAEKKQASAAAKVGASAGKTGPASSGSAGVNNGVDEDEDDDEEGRVSMVGMKNKKRRVGQARATPAAVPGTGAGDTEDAVEKGDNGTAETEAPVKQVPSKGRKKATSYLDELLAERSKKRKKR